MTDIDPLAGVTVFVTAARTGSFTQAAERLGMTKSAVGKSIARLEARLSAKLFHRTTRLTKLTTDGEAFFATCSAALDEVSATQAALTSSGKVLTGRLRIDMPVAFGRRVLLPILLEIIKPHPGLTLSLNFSDATVDPMQSEVDLISRQVCARPTCSTVRIRCSWTSMRQPLARESPTVLWSTRR